MRHLLVVILLGAGVACAPNQQDADLRAEVKELREDVTELQELVVAQKERKQGAGDDMKAAKRRRLMAARAGKASGGAAGGGAAAAQAKLSDPVEGGTIVSLEGNAEKAIINAPNSGPRYELPSTVPPGEYGLWVAFPDGKPKYIAKMTVADKAVVVTCIEAKKTCTVL